MYEYGVDLTGFLASYFTGYVGASVNDNSGKMAVSSSALADAFYNAEGGEANVTFESIDSTFASIAASMTAYIRNNGDADMSEPATGQVMETLTCIHIRWRLLAYPAALAAVTITFFTALLAKEFSEGRNGIGHHVKGDTTLALLLHGLDEKTLKKAEAIIESSGNDSSKVRKEREIVRQLGSNIAWKEICSKGGRRCSVTCK